MFWVLKGTVSLKRFFWVLTIYVEVEQQENIFFCYTLLTLAAVMYVRNKDSNIQGRSLMW